MFKLPHTSPHLCIQVVQEGGVQVAADVLIHGADEALSQGVGLQEEGVEGVGQSMIGIVYCSLPVEKTPAYPAEQGSEI